MLFKTLAVTAALVSLAVIPVKGTDYQVVVGGTGVLAYTPNQVNAAVGDTVTFTFKTKNHTVTQSTLQDPCQAMSSGFDSGFIPVSDDNAANLPTAQFTVQDTNPVWAYCRQANHCQQGMVFAINPGNNFAAFQAAATGGANSTTTNATGYSTATATASAAYPSATTTTTGTNHVVTVGGPNQLFYSPSNISANVGDTITFQFQVKNHTVTQSSFATPCRSLTLTSTSGQVGFDSGFMPVAADATTFPNYTISVNDTNPIWAYCRQTGHCGSGMVFSVNAVESGPNNFAAFQAAAKVQNGTSSTASSSAAGASSTLSGKDANGATPTFAGRGAGIAIGLVGVAFALML
jgi:plastocyanin